ncbi:hypothetical protein ACQQ4G_003129 [Listeria monocytogenes]
MITLKEAYNKILEQNPTLKVDSISDVGYCWVFGLVDKQTNEALDEPPLCVNKESGNVETYYLPDLKHFEELENAVEIDLKDIK